ncbi:MAG: PAS domain-containing sensor histidine kinase [Fibrobacteres bacterium]|nr:PAS domain-containing sensor histidine kinase [Fibrobacterota bacterium]
MIQDAFTQSDYAINITDPKGILLKVNDAYLRLYKVSDESQILGQTQRLIRSPFTPDSVYKEMWSTISAGKVWRGEMGNRALDGSDVFIHLTISPIRRDGEIVGYMGFSMDRAQQVVLERQLFHANKLVALGTLGAGLAHELNNPLASILLDAEYLREAVNKIPDPADRQAALDASDSVIRGSERIRRVLEHLLKYSKKDESAAPSEIDLASLLEESLLFVERQLKSRGIDIQVESAQGILISGNRTQLESVLHNLIANSRDAFNNVNVVAKLIRFSAFFRAEDNMAVIDYRDNAGGIASDVMSRIFEPFFTTKGGEGTGLGLSISSQVVAQHGGTISCESQAGETRFRILLPAKLDPNKAAQASRPKPKAAHEASSVFVKAP